MMLARQVDLADPEAVRRRLRALQKKVREIEKLKAAPPETLELLQKDRHSIENSAYYLS